MRMVMASTARVDPRYIIDVTKCFALTGGGKGHVGKQCSKKPVKGKFFCRTHKALDLVLVGGLREDLDKIAAAGKILKQVSKARRRYV